MAIHSIDNPAATIFGYCGFFYEIIDEVNKEVALVKATYAPERCIIPKSVEYKGEEYVVTALKPRKEDASVIITPSDKRRKPYRERKLSDCLQPFDKLKDGTDHGCYSNTTLIEVVLPITINRLEAGFCWCENLKSVNIPEGITMLDTATFYKCYALENVVIPQSVTQIKDVVFYGCRSLKHIIIPSAVETIGPEAFSRAGTIEVDIYNDEGKVNIHPDAFFRTDAKINYLGKKAAPKPIQKPQTGKKEATSTSKAEPKVTGAKNVNGKDLTSFNLKNIITVDDFRKQFFEAFGANIYIYQGRSKVSGNVTLGECGLTTEGVFECKANFTVGYFIEKMQADFGLKVKVYTSDNWVAVLDGLTLESAGKVKKNATKADMEKLMVY